MELYLLTALMARPTEKATEVGQLHTELLPQRRAPDLSEHELVLVELEAALAAAERWASCPVFGFMLVRV